MVVDFELALGMSYSHSMGISDFIFASIFDLLNRFIFWVRCFNIFALLLMIRFAVHLSLVKESGVASGYAGSVIGHL